MVALETWRTVAMATAGLMLALLLAVPLALLSVRSAVGVRLERAHGAAGRRACAKWCAGR